MSCCLIDGRSGRWRRLKRSNGFVLSPEALPPGVERAFLESLVTAIGADRLAAGLLFCDVLPPKDLPGRLFGFAHFSTMRGFGLPAL